MYVAAQGVMGVKGEKGGAGLPGPNGNPGPTIKGERGDPGVQGKRTIMQVHLKCQCSLQARKVLQPSQEWMVQRGVKVYHHQ